MILFRRNGLAKVKKARPTTPIKRKRHPLESVRRSTRLLDGVAAVERYGAGSDDEDAPVRTKKLRTFVRQRDESLTPEQRATLDAFDEADFEIFLINELNDSPANVRTVMRQVRKLVSGAGVHYQGWNEDVVFREHQPVSLEDDLVRITADARDFLDQNGRDKSNGWLLNHPLRKLLIYQLHLLRRSDAC